jgi:hypothetical protein
LTGVQHNNKYSDLDKRIKDELDIDIQNDEENNYNNNMELGIINAYEEALVRSPRHKKKYFEETSSNKSNSPSKVDFIKENADNIGKNQPKNYRERLTEAQLNRLIQLETDIDESFLADEGMCSYLLAISNKPEKEKLE